MMASKYLTFARLRTSKSGKTEIWGVDSKSSGDLLALVKWYAPWRQYVLHPIPYTVWNTTCLAEITAFIDQLMEDRK